MQKIVAKFRMVQCDINVILFQKLNCLSIYEYHILIRRCDFIDGDDWMIDHTLYL